ncbi:MAG: ABC transporter permease [Marinosulfonomonas sp.]|nr:ABC transporter permease [Marinosulfonomonas sp.]
MFDTSSPPKFQTIRVIVALMIREMITRYGRSWGGYFWAIAEPVGMIAVLSLAFSQFLRTPPIGQSFVLFYATGYIPFHFFATLSAQTSSAVQFNKSLITFPMVTPIDTVLARAILGILTMVVVAAIVIFGIIALVPDPVRVSLPEFILACLAASVLGVGAGTLNVVLFAFLPVWRNIWSVINRPLFIISGIFFTFESMPASLQTLLWWNPLVHVTGEARKAFYPVYDGAYVSLGYVFGIGIVAFLLGGALMIRHQSFIVENS